MASKLSIEAVARACARHPWRAAALWIVAILIAATLAVAVLGRALNV
jgi:hypothetical protein